MATGPKKGTPIDLFLCAAVCRNVDAAGTDALEDLDLAKPLQQMRDIYIYIYARTMQGLVCVRY